MKFVKLTNVGGAPIWIAPQWVTHVSKPLAGDYDGPVHAVVIVSGAHYAVRESPEEAVKLIEAST